MNPAIEREATAGRYLHLVVSDSGLGGLAVCAGLERNLRASGRYRRVRLSYFNAAPDPGQGYNDLPDTPARAALLDRTLAAMEGLRPDRIVLACNTLSVLYEHTAHFQHNAARVTGIIEAGVRLFAAALAADPAGVLLLLGTRTTIDSGVHRRRLVDGGITAERIGSVSCHGLARAIERDPEAPAVSQLIAQCTAALPALKLEGERLYAGLACTHYGFVASRIAQALERASGLPVHLLDPNEALVETLAPVSAIPAVRENREPVVSVQVLSKVPLSEQGRKAIAGRLRAVSEVTASALLSYTCDSELF
jgi:glutamate racemase